MLCAQCTMGFQGLFLSGTDFIGRGFPVRLNDDTIKDAFLRYASFGERQDCI